MTRQEHEEFKREISKSLTIIFSHAFGTADPRLNDDELEKHAKMIQELHHQYWDALNYLNQIRSKASWFFDEYKPKKTENEE